MSPKKIGIAMAALWMTLSVVSSAFANIPQVVSDAQNLLIEGCRVNAERTGYHQLYVNGNFSGNFVLGNYYDAQRLGNDIQTHLYRGVCRYRSYSEQSYILSLIRDHNLIDDFASYRYSGCNVRKYVDGYHQIYVHGTFRGNYDYRSSVDMENLQKTLVSHIIAGNCGVGGSYPNPNPTYPPAPPTSRCPDPNTIWDARLNRCVSRATPVPVPVPQPRVYTCSIYGITSRSVDLNSAKRDVLAKCAAASRGYVCQGSQVSCY